ncbi:MAG TPA: DUF4445 domain-containing protein [Chloroflexi bacterium]|jgi:uncharacterized 2Fe-2S/4Fe-4S cluster protein (DUF4445 family)|nr:DUF4445 domain-containing protein [Chloroflexota bacterium]
MKIRFEPYGVTTEVEAGHTLLDAAVAAGVEIESVCGGRGTCAKCKVIVTRGVSASTALEQRGLTAEELASGYRLACQAVIEGDTEVVVPEESRRSRVNILARGTEGDVPLEPWVMRHTLHVPAATLREQTPDWDNVARLLTRDGRPMPRPTLRVLRALPGALRAQDGHITLVQVDERIIDVMPGAGPARLTGMAFDIGTTTVVGYLVDLETGDPLAVASRLNPQTRYGDDVVSRIDHASRQDGGLQTMQSEIVGAMNQIIAETAGIAGLDDPVYAITVVGNTTMHHLFLGINPAALAQSPYVPVVTSALCIEAAHLGLAMHPEGAVWVLPNIAGWVGADTVGVLLATDVHRQDEPALVIDIGTNGEMALGSRKRLLTCSTAAGPAFEGAHLSCGMRAADGAIDLVEIDREKDDPVHWHTIGDAVPRGICGSGLVDTVAGLLRAGVIDSTGLIQNGDALRHNGYAALADRIVGEGRHRAFHLVDGERGMGGRTIAITQHDVRVLQLAKGAIRAGIEILMQELSVGPDDVKRVYLAGAFGNYIRPESALTIGLIPHFTEAELIPVGNAAGSGARMALISRSARDETVEILSHVEYLELSGRPDFQYQFAEAMMF